MSLPVKRTYGSRQSRPSFRSSSLDLSSSPATPSLKRPFSERLSFTNTPASKRPRLTASISDKDTKKSRVKKVSTQKSLTQLHFSIDTSVLRTCPLCDLTYTKGAPDDETMHKAHCARVQRGMEWGKEEEKESAKAGVREIQSSVKLKNGKKGRIICFKADVGGKIGSKLAILLDTIALALSSPPLTEPILRATKVYLFLLPSITSSSRERIVGCVLAQQITTAMAVAAPADLPDADGAPPTATLVAVDTSSGLFCHPEPLPTPLGIPRLFIPSTHRRQGIAARLLDAAAATFVHGCKLSPARGEVAFTQPTNSGRAVMESWGGGAVRIYQE